MEEKDKKPTIDFRLEGSVYKTRTTPRYDRRKPYLLPDDKKLISIIPGLILEVLVSEGDTVTAGDEVIILEAMKMKNRIQISGDGKVRKIHVKKGDCIPKGTVMLELE